MAGIRRWENALVGTSPSDLLVGCARGYLLVDEWTTASIAGETGWDNATASGGSVALSTNGIDYNHVGIVTLSRGTTAGGRAALHRGGNTTVLGGGALAMECIVRFGANIPTSGENYGVVVGLGDTLTALSQTDGVYFVFDRNLSTANWYCVTASNGTRTQTNSGVAFAASTWVKLRIEVDASGAEARFYVNDVLVVTTYANIPLGTSRICSPQIALVGVAGTADRTFDIDACAFGQTFSTPR